MRDKIIKYYLVPSIAGIIALTQIIQTCNGLTRWKGGGFGMYSEIHFTEREVWIGMIGSLARADKEKFNDSVSQLVQEVKLRPNDSSAFKLLKELYRKIPTDTLVLQVWQPYLDPRDLSFTRILIYEISYPKQSKPNS